MLWVHRLAVSSAAAPMRYCSCLEVRRGPGPFQRPQGLKHLLTEWTQEQEFHLLEVVDWIWQANNIIVPSIH